jgi:MoaA/NifB/PqqE/SkfB family radical SAM enzyme
MLVTKKQLTDEQQKTLVANFHKLGPFYQGIDIHPMLDCARIPDIVRSDLNPVQPDIAARLLAGQLSIVRPGILREEFFGGIFYDNKNFVQQEVDFCAFDVLKMLQAPITGTEICNALRHKYNLEQELESTLLALYQAGIIGLKSAPADIRVIPADDLNISYLQTPIIVEVELTHGCFRECRHCAYSSSPTVNTSNDLKAEEWAVIFQKLADAGVLVVQLTGGDPFFRRDIFEILEAADEVGLSIYVRSDTVALKPANVKRIKSLKHLWHIGTSIDGANAEQHDWMRGSGAFAILCDRIQKLSSSGIRVSAGATLHKKNFTSVREMGKLSNSLGAHWFDIGFLSPVGRGHDLVDFVLDASEVQTALNLYLEGIAKQEYQPFHSHYHRRNDKESPFKDASEVLEYFPFMTEWPWSRLRIDPQGNTYTAGKLKGSDLSSGYNLLTEDVREAWRHSPNLVRLRDYGVGKRLHSLDFRVIRMPQDIMKKNSV